MTKTTMVEGKLKSPAETNTPESDYRAEVPVAGLPEAEQDGDRILLVRQDAKLSKLFL